MNEHFIRRDRCPACGAGEHVELYRCAYTSPPISAFLVRTYGRAGHIDLEYLQGADYALRECGACGLIFQHEVPNDHLMRILYEEWVSAEFSLHKRARNAAAVRGRIALEIMAIADLLQRPPESLRVLDFGMGWGDWCRMAQAFGCEAFGVETASSRIEHARKLNVPVLAPGDLPPASFDVVNSDQVLEHLAEPYGAVAVVAEALRPHGLLKISVPNGRRVKRRLRRPDFSAPKGSRRSLHDVSPLQHVNCFQHASLVRLVERAGLRRIPFPATLRYRYAPTWERPANLLRRTVGQHVRASLRQETVVWFRKSGTLTSTG
ncbi:MAG TPA: class I SAM-dependent methyltransferase [Actinomycetota bacterium]|nr:class I SAM-dependent methyltransferase [Actinomycetota bacterium]